jgi:hypothetical protein
VQKGEYTEGTKVCEVCEEVSAGMLALNFCAPLSLTIEPRGPIGGTCARVCVRVCACVCVCACESHVKTVRDHVMIE